MNSKTVAVSVASFAAGVVSTASFIGIFGIVIYRDIRKLTSEQPRTEYRYSYNPRLKIAGDNQK